MPSWLDLDPEERRDALVGFVMLMSAMAAHAMLETARDALFLSRLPATQLPWAYLSIAVLAFGAARLNYWLLRAFPDQRWAPTVTLLAAAAGNVGFFFLVDEQGGVGPYAFYVWTGLVATIVVVQLWLLLENAVTVTQAKRVFGVIAAGGVLGATLGALAADLLLGSVLGARELLVVAAGVMAFGALGPALWSRDRVAVTPPSRRVARSRESRTHAIRVLCSEPYLRRMLMLVVISTVALTGVDYVFKSVVADAVSVERLGPFFARFYLILNAIALFVQLAFASWLLGRFGVNQALLILPLLLLAGVGGFLIVPGIVAVGVLKGVDGTLRHSVHRTGLEVLYLPVPRDIRERYKTVIDGVGGRGGQALASVVILGAVAVGAESAHLVVGLGALAAVWIVVLLGIKGHYVELFRHNLREGTIETQVDLAQLDLHSLEALVGALSSEHDEEVLTALDLFERHDKAHLVPVLILYHPSHLVVQRALEIFADAGRTDFLSVARRLLREHDDEVRAAALRAVTGVEPDESLLRQALEDDSPIVYATALVGLLSHNYGDPGRLGAAVERCIREGEPETRRALADAIRHQRDPGFAPSLMQLARTDDMRVRFAVARAMAAIPDERFLTPLMDMLARGRLRSEARRAILGVGPVALSFLDEALWDTTLPRKVRRHLPRTISRFDPRRAASVLLRHLADEADGAVRYKILRGLGRIRHDHPDVPLDRRLLRDLVQGTLGRTVQVLDWRVATERAQASDDALRTPGGELLVAVLQEKETRALERLFRLLGLVHPEEDFQLLWQGLHSGDAKVRAASREVLEHVVDTPARGAVVALVSEQSDARRLERAASALGATPSRPSYQDRLTAMLADDSEAVRSVAAHHIGELELGELEESLRAAKPEKPSFLTEVIERALASVHGRSGRVSDVA